MTDIVPYEEPARGWIGPQDAFRQLVDDFWRGKSPRTIKAYKEDLLRVADWLGIKDEVALAKEFLAHGPGPANMVAERFKDWGTKKGWAPAYVNNHLAALRSVVKFARKAGRVVWALDVSDLKAQPFRDTLGPGMDGMAKTIHEASKQENPARASRDVAVLSLFATRGLRRDEVVTLDLEHVEFNHGGRSRLLVKRKKRLEREWVSIPDDTAATLAAWLAHRGDASGPLFTSFAVRNRRPDQRLAESSVWAIVRQHARAAGLETRPHGFRHAAVTAVLDETDGNVRGAQLFAGHENPATTMRYDDNRKDIAGEMSDLVAGALKKALEKVRKDEKDAKPSE